MYDIMLYHFVFSDTPSKFRIIIRCPADDIDQGRVQGFAFGLEQ